MKKITSVPVVLSLGSNIGYQFSNLKKNLITAILFLQEKVSNLKCSSYYQTSPLNYLNQNDFLNLVLIGKTSLSAMELLNFNQEIEKKMKSKKKVPQGPRIIDIDIIFYNNKKINQNNLIIPHPRFNQRLFVLIPLLEIAPNFYDPINKIKIKDYVQEELFILQKIKKLK